MNPDIWYYLSVLTCCACPFIIMFNDDKKAKCDICKKYFKKKNMESVAFYDTGVVSHYRCADCYRKHLVNEMLDESSDSTTAFLKKYGGLIDED